METKKGNLINLAKQGEFDVIIHGCNCFHTMGAGIAKDIKHHFPGAFLADKKTPFGSFAKLGTFSESEETVNGHTFIVCNAYTQFHPGSASNSNESLDIRYNAIASALTAIQALYAGKRIGIPLIGAGLAGGSWDVIRPIIEKTIPNATIIEFDNSLTLL
jgi:O-acetyl-ADP-ribose deacetylase (regulator of RNase III)